MITLVAGLAWAGSPAAELHGDLKSFTTATIPYAGYPLEPSEPSATGVADGRVKLTWRPADGVKVQVHQTATALTSAPNGSLGPSTGVGLLAPEVVDLSWVAYDEAMTLRGRVDRALVKLDRGPISVTAGRQAVSFGSGVAFTPMDLVNPFNPSYIDQEYKPGVDSLRVDAYAGMSFLTVVAAYTGSWDREGSVLVAYGQTTAGVTDLGVFVGSVNGDGVVGASVVSSFGEVGLHGDVTVTAPDGGEEPFVRGVAGGLWRPGANTTLTAEGYVQTLGGASPAAYLQVASSDRFARGELWLMGRTYGALAASQQVLTELSLSGALIANIEDGSVFLAPSLSWSASSNVEVVMGGFMGLGERPGLTSFPGGDGEAIDVPVLRSEFGTYPGASFLQMRSYF